MLIIIILVACFVFALLAKRHIEQIREKHRIEDGIEETNEIKDVLDEKEQSLKEENFTVEL